METDGLTTVIESSYGKILIPELVCSVSVGDTEHKVAEHGSAVVNE
jgi:hypothetical protein